MQADATVDRLPKALCMQPWADAHLLQVQVGASSWRLHIKRQLNYAMQAPVILHKIDGYQLDKNANRCMFFHARSRTQQSQAPMVSVTHFQDRDGNFLAELSPRRYFCVQCHVPQVPLEPLVPNRFVDVDQMLYPAAASAPARKGK
jgi:nitrate reductase (cytochrome), electron transfer subunit